MDAFYASVEQRDNASLKGRPVIVGGDRLRGVVCAASYEARPFGVRSAMPMSTALALAPQAIVLAPRMAVYAEVSQAVFSIFERFTPMVEPLSLDEAFLDVTASHALFGSAVDIASAIRHTIAKELSLESSAGIASMKFVAKIVSDLAKPNGQRQVEAGDVQSFLAPLPVSRLWGVGPQTKRQCDRLGLLTIGDVAKRPLPWLMSHFGKQGQRFFELSRGIDERLVVSDRQAKSISAQETFWQDVSDREVLSVQLHEQALKVARRLRGAQRQATVLALTLRDESFVSTTHQMTLPEATDAGQTLYRMAMRLLERFSLEKPIRMTQLSCSQLSGNNAQTALFESPDVVKSRHLNLAIDRLEKKFGTAVVKPAHLLAASHNKRPK